MTPTRAATVAAVLSSEYYDSSLVSAPFLTTEQLFARYPQRGRTWLFALTRAPYFVPRVNGGFRLDLVVGFENMVAAGVWHPETGALDPGTGRPLAETGTSGDAVQAVTADDAESNLRVVPDRHGAPAVASTVGGDQAASNPGGSVACQAKEKPRRMTKAERKIAGVA